MAIGSLVVKIGADITGLVRDGKRGADSLGKLEGATKKLGTVLKVLAVGVVAKELIELVNGSMKAIDASAKLSRQLGGTIAGLRGLQLAASDAGIGTDGLRSAMEALNEKLGEAARTGAGEAADALKRLGLSARELGEMDLDQRMAAIADAIQETGLSSQGTQDALAKMGITQGEIVRLMQDGGDAIRGARTEIEAFGLALSDVDAAKVEAANAAMERIKLATTAIGEQLAVGLSPVITEISNQFIDVAKDAGGLKSSIQSVIEFGIKGFGFLGDVVRGIHLVFKTVELAAWGLGTALGLVFHGGVIVIEEFVDGAVGSINLLIAQMNKIPGVSILPIDIEKGTYSKAMGEFAKNMIATTADVFQQLQDLATEEWPSEKARKFFAEVQAAAQETAENVTKSREKIQFGDAAAGGGPTEADTKEIEAARAKLQSQLDLLREHLMSEEQLENERHADRLQQLNAALAAELPLIGGYAKLREGLEKKHAKAIADIREKGLEKTNQVTAMGMAANSRMLIGMADKLAQSLSSNAKEQFDIHKGFAIADALISGAQGVAQTYGAYPYPVGIPMAIAHGALAAAQVGIIASQQFQGGGRRVMASSAAAAPSGGGGPSRPTAQAATGGVTGGSSALAQINIAGNNFGREQVISLIEGINEAIGDGARLVVQ